MAQPTALTVVDISRFRDPGTDRDAFLAELRSAAHEVGFFYVTGHGVPASVRDEILHAARAFFALPVEPRLEIENLNSPQFRGYTRTGTEYTAGSADWREQIDIGPECEAIPTGPEDPDCLRLVGPNQWPSALAELRDTVLRWQAEALRVSREVLRALAAALGQDERYFDEWFDDEAAVHVKIVHCPPRPAEDADQGVGAHKDYGYLPLLQQDEVGGLQVQREDGGWIDAVPVPDAFVFNIGEGRLRAGLLRLCGPAHGGPGAVEVAPGRLRTPTLRSRDSDRRESPGRPEPARTVRTGDGAVRTATPVRRRSRRVRRGAPVRVGTPAACRGPRPRPVCACRRCGGAVHRGVCWRGG
ncbi:isopenicillin N synthase family oxygenase [Streptomyces sp. NBC_01478]|nr:2-oxoglutarate and iron-dependent oxygenase domain-containing protein [Streptomyces sp. NBC_01478]